MGVNAVLVDDVAKELDLFQEELTFFGFYMETETTNASEDFTYLV